jgi:hypothetical protein
MICHESIRRDREPGSPLGAAVLTGSAAPIQTQVSQFLHCLSHNLRNCKDSRLRVVLVSCNAAIYHYLSKPPFSQYYVPHLFTTLNSSKLAKYDIVVLDEGLPPFTVETFITREAAHKEWLSRGRSKEDSPEEDFPRSFPDFAKLYDGRNFALYADKMEELVDEANSTFDQWKRYLVTESGFSVIRLKHSQTDMFLVRRCVLLPSTALSTWENQFNQNTTKLLDLCIQRLSEEYVESCQCDRTRMNRVFYVKDVERNRSWVKQAHMSFRDVSLWQMEVMLKKWRTDKALQAWSTNLLSQ